MGKRKSGREIIERAGDIFFIAPFSKLTADEIASKAGVSKRTFYKYFPSKDSFIDALIQKFLDDTLAKIKELDRTESDTIKRMYATAAIIQKAISTLNMTFMDDIRKNYPRIWKKIDEFRTKNARGRIENFLREGMKKGMFKKLDPDIASGAFIGAIRAVVNPQILVNLSVSADEAVRTIFEIFLEGIKKC